MEIIDEHGNKVESVPLDQMISTVQSFIFIGTGRMVFIDPRVADDTRQLTMLGHAYDVAIGKIRGRSFSFDSGSVDWEGFFARRRNRSRW